MKILIASDSFKESLSSFEVGLALKKGLQKVLTDTKIDIIPVADGGEGTVEAIVKATNGRIVKTFVHDPLMRKIDSFFGITGDGSTAIIEMAAASGLALLQSSERNPWITSSYGTGELILGAIQEGCRNIIIGVGGSATNDGGTGMIKALGATISDEEGKDTGTGGGELGRIKEIGYSELKRKANDINFIAACDVVNPLTGPGGATYVFAPQKGADKNMLDSLEKNMIAYSQILYKMFNKDVSAIPGSGAAGGLGAALMAFLNTDLRPGFDVISALLHLEEKIMDADLIITGEGKIDYQTRFGKTPQGVARLAKKYNKPVISIAGTLGKDWESLHDIFDVILSITDKPMSLEDAIKNASLLCENTGERIGRMMNLFEFMQLKNRDN